MRGSLTHGFSKNYLWPCPQNINGHRNSPKPSRSSHRSSPHTIPSGVILPPCLDILSFLWCASASSAQIVAHSPFFLSTSLSGLTGPTDVYMIQLNLPPCIPHACRYAQILRHSTLGFTHRKLNTMGWDLTRLGQSWVACFARSVSSPGGGSLQEFRGLINRKRLTWI